MRKTVKWCYVERGACMLALIGIVAGCIISCNSEPKKQESAPLRLMAPIPSSTWKTIPGKEWYFTATRPMPVKPGDTVLVGAEYNEISLNDINGLPGKPIVFIRVGAMARVGARHYGNPMVVQRCSYLVFDGFEVGPDSGYAAQGWNIQSSHNIEIRNSVVKNANVGFFTNPATGHFPNIWIHDVTVKNINDKNHTSFDEAFYIGRTSGQSPEVNSFENLIIENVILEDIGGDGFQIANGKNIIVRNCKAYRVGTNKINDQWFVYFNGGGTSGLWENNYAEDCTGTPFQILGTGSVTFRNNTAVRCATGDKQDGFYIRQSFPTLQVRLLGNKIDKVNRNWITQVTPGLVIEDKGNSFGAVVQPPITRVDSVARSLYDSVVKRNRADREFINRP